MVGKLKSRIAILTSATSYALISASCDHSADPGRKPHAVVVVTARSEKLADDHSGTVVATFLLANRGDHILRFGSAAPTCGCSKAVIRPEVVNPGGTATLEVEGIPPSSGSRLVQIEIPTNDPDQAKLTIDWNLRANPVAPSLQTPKPEISLGVLRLGQLPSPQSLDFDILEYRDRSPFIRALQFDHDMLRVDGGMISEKNSVDTRFITRSYPVVSLKICTFASTLRSISVPEHLGAGPEAL